jgi:choice-of-anchor C domain-containing protein
MRTTTSSLSRLTHVASLLFIATGFVVGQNVINGSFEAGIDPGVSTTLEAPDGTTITGWTLQSGSIDYIGTRWMAGEGSRSLDMTGVSAGTILQSVSGFTPGQTYRLSFLMAANTEGGDIVKSLKARIGPVAQTFSFDGTGLSGGNMGWSQRTMDFTATNSTMELSFESLHDGLYGPALDNVAITPVTSTPPALTIRSCVEVCWQSQPAIRYQLQRAPSPSSAHWVNIGEPVTGTGDSHCVNDCDQGFAQRIYRLLLVP